MRLGLAAAGVRRRLPGIARASLGALRIAAGTDRRNDVEWRILRYNDVFAAGIDSVARANGDVTVAVVAHHLQSAHDAPAVEVAVVQPVLRLDVGLQTGEVGGGQNLSRAPERPIERLEATAHGAAAAGFVTILDVLFHGALLARVDGPRLMSALSLSG